MRTFLKQLARSAEAAVNLGRIKHNQAVLARRLALLEDASVSLPPERTTSCLCTQQRCASPEFFAWSEELRERARHHRKLWEFVFIAQSLHERGMLSAGRKGLGFGVGSEPLSSAFAARGCTVVGTDQPPTRAAQSGWAEGAQLATSLASLNGRGICPQEVFAERVTYRPVDMNHVPSDLTDFDFCWSACALEHLGDLAAGMAFVERSLDCLRPGGVAVHTTEFNVSSNDETLERGATVIYRRRDIEALIRTLEAAGHEVSPVDWNPGEGTLDEYVDAPPYDSDAHVKLSIWGHTTTSLGLIVRRRA